MFDGRLGTQCLRPQEMDPDKARFNRSVSDLAAYMKARTIAAMSRFRLRPCQATRLALHSKLHASGVECGAIRLHGTRLCFARALQARKIPVRVWQQVRRLLAFKQERVQFSLDNPALKCALSPCRPEARASQSC